MGLGSLVPVEYFANKNFEFLPDNKTVQRFEVCKLIVHKQLVPRQKTNVFNIIMY